MLGTLLKGASTAGGIKYIGSVIKTGANATSWDTSGEALDILSIARTGDLVVIAFSFDNGSDNTFTWNGMIFNEIRNATGVNFPGGYAGYKIVSATDTNPYVTGVTSASWLGLSVVASVFRGTSQFVSGANANSSSGMPDPPSLTANGDLWIAIGFLDDDAVTNWTAPANYTLATYATYGGPTDISSTAIAYRIETLTSDDPAAFGGSGSDSWLASTAAFAV